MRRAPSWVLNFCPQSVPACLETLNPGSIASKKKICRSHMAGPPSSGPGFVPRNEHIFMVDHYMITIDQRFGNPWNLENHDGLPWCVCVCLCCIYNYIYIKLLSITSKDFLITCDHLLIHPLSLVYFSKASVLQPVFPKCRHLLQRCTQNHVSVHNIHNII